MAENNLLALFGAPDNGTKVKSPEGEDRVVNVQRSSPDQIDLGSLFGEPDADPGYDTRADDTAKRRSPVTAPTEVDKGAFTLNMEDIEWAGQQAIRTTRLAVKNFPIAGFTPVQLEQGMRAWGAVFERPLAGLTALAVETPYADANASALKVFAKGMLNPEEYRPERMTEALIDAGMEPVSAASLATLGQFGFYLGMGNVLARITTVGKVKLLDKTLKNVRTALGEAERQGHDLNKLKAADLKINLDELAKHKGIMEIVDFFLQSRGLKILPKSLGFNPVPPPVIKSITFSPVTGKELTILRSSSIVPPARTFPSAPKEVGREIVQDRGGEKLEMGMEKVPAIPVVKAKPPVQKPSVLPAGKVKPTVNLSTGVRKAIDNIVINEMTALKVVKKAEVKASKEGYAEGKREIRGLETVKRQVEGLVKSIEALGRRKMPDEYKEQVDAILEQYDLKKRTTRTKEKRMGRAQFIEDAEARGDLAFVDKDYFKDMGIQTTLDEMSVEDLELLKNQLTALVTIGVNTGKMIAGKEAQDFENYIDRTVAKIYARGKKTEVIIAPNTNIYRPPSATEQTDMDEFFDEVDRYFAGHRKIENLAQVLRISAELWKPMQDASNWEMRKFEKVSRRFKNIFSKIADKSFEMRTPTIAIEGKTDKISMWEAIAVAFNSETVGNVERLIRGQGYTEEQIRNIRDQIGPENREFVDDTLDLIGAQWVDTSAISIKAVGIVPKKEEGRYFPIAEDYGQSEAARLRESKKDLMKKVFTQAFLEKGFTKSRVGGSAPVDLNVLPVIMKHLRDVVHYNAFAIPLRDTQKLINHPRFKRAMVEVMNEATYDELIPWLKDYVNPNGLMARDNFERIAVGLRQGGTGAILGYKVSVSILQALSASQGVALIGADYFAKGVAKFYFGNGTPRQSMIGAIKFIYSRIPELKHRRTRVDRDLNDFLETKEMKAIMKGMPGDVKSMMFEMIRGVDFVTVMPVALGAYMKEMDSSGNAELAADYAASTIRISQPMGSTKDLPRALRGSPYQKLFTMFKTFYITMHNMTVDMKDEFRFSNESYGTRTAQASRWLFFTYLLPAILSTFIRSGGTKWDLREGEVRKEYYKGLATYPISGLLFASDVVQGLATGFGLGAPGLKSMDETIKAAKGKDLYTVGKHSVKAVGTLLGKPVDAGFVMAEGAYDMWKLKSLDFRKLVYSKYSLGIDDEEDTDGTFLTK